jgi:hypothetical protein
MMSTSSFVDEVPPGVGFEPPEWPPTGQSNAIASRSGVHSSVSRQAPARRSHDLRSRSPWPMVVALVVFGVGAAAFAYVLKKDGVSQADDAAKAAAVAAPAPAAVPASAPATAPATAPKETEPDRPEVAGAIPKPERETPEPKKPEPKKPEPKRAEPKKPEPKKPEPKKPEPRKVEPKKVEPAVAVKGGGFLTINAEPYATIYIDGKKRGYTPIVRLSLPAGSHAIRLVSSAGQPDKKMTVKVGAGEDVRKFVKW